MEGIQRLIVHEGTLQSTLQRYPHYYHYYFEGSSKTVEMNLQASGPWDKQQSHIFYQLSHTSSLLTSGKDKDERLAESMCAHSGSRKNIVMNCTTFRSMTDGLQDTDLLRLKFLSPDDNGAVIASQHFLKSDTSSRRGSGRSFRRRSRRRNTSQEMTVPCPLVPLETFQWDKMER